ncbi:MAG TPA: hypothetical protein VGH38_33320 [Bryobacteraceae bacterium]|jgi:hypothetical protein
MHTPSLWPIVLDSDYMKQGGADRLCPDHLGRPRFSLLLDSIGK